MGRMYGTEVMSNSFETRHTSSNVAFFAYEYNHLEQLLAKP